MNLPRVSFLAVTFLLLQTGFLPATEQDYLTHIKPLLAEKCLSCHGVLKQEAGLRLGTRALMIQSDVIVPGNPDESPILERVLSHGDDRMPPEGEGSALTPEQIKLIRRWIEQGASAPDETTLSDPSQHWAFRPIMVPTHTSAPWIPGDVDAENPIDRLLHQAQTDRKLRPAPLASRSILLRRLYLDLIGLPPSEEQLRDTRPIAVIADELLANPQHGERWARHWMDVWRYSDWYGLGKQLRYSQKHLWHWRDWIVDSLNQDKGYDQMIVEMLAGDEVAPTDDAVIAATGYLARNYYLFNRTTWLDSTIEHTSKAFLGLTMNCAKCHDHKYDPITQLDYYRFRAIFEPHQIRLDPIPGETDFEKAGLPRAFDDHVDQATYLHRRGDPKDPDKEKRIEPGVPEILSQFAPPIVPVPLPRWAYAPGSRDYVQKDQIAMAEAGVERARQKLTQSERAMTERALTEREVSETAAETPGFQFHDNFDALDETRWELVGDGWKHEAGELRQIVSTRERQLARLKQKLPRDFELRCSYTTTGGETYKSVTFRFDQSDDGYANYVYSSAHAPGPKVQVAFEREGKSTYPAQGRKAKTIELGKQYDLRFAVRDTLVNVWLDDEFLIAYRYPDRREGHLAISGFDATVAIDSISIQSLAPSVPLTESGQKHSLSTEEAKRSVKVANLELALAKQQLRELQTVIQAEQTSSASNTSHESKKHSTAEAHRQQLLTQIAKLKLQREVDAADAKKIQQIEKSLGELTQDLETPSNADVVYESLRGAKKALESPADKEEDYPSTFAPVSTGRRSALAHWIVSERNPLTARVAVNHVWMRHFGTPLVESVFDFGLRAKEPLHHSLLDHLAWEFMQSGWSFRHLHLLIVNSQAYQRSASTLGTDDATIQSDPNNQFYWRMNSRRMESQVIRDSLIAIAGELDTSMGGPSLSPSNKTRRRSLYFQHSRDEKLTFLETFDNADILQCYRRSESIVPQQALALSNSQLAIEMAHAIAKKLDSASVDPSDREFIAKTFFALLGRDPTPEEHSECQLFFNELSELADPPDRITIRSRFVQAILNHNDFITIR
ncbi:MAG: DUF1553 domain-containing protein [Rubripirellula sp.]